MLALSDLGPRIMICGPSNSGKSTLAAAVGQKLGIPAVHLDQLYHHPNTNWQPRPREEFERLHAEAVAGESWAIEGNYSSLMPPRSSRATGIVLTASEPWRALLRYFRRTLFESSRPGHLDGAEDRLNWIMMHLIIIDQPRKRQRDADFLTATGLPMVRLESMRALNVCYRSWGLQAKAPDHGAHR